METQDEQNEYVIQLKEVFNSCDPNGCGNLDKSGLINLCQRLQLEEQAPFLINRLLRNNAHAVVNFDDFKDCFVALLAQSIDEPENIEINLRVASPVEREVSPKYVWGNKKYGRRSRPESDDASDSENEMLSDYSDPEVFCVESSIEKNILDDRLSIPLEVDETEKHDGRPPPATTFTEVRPLFKKRRRTSGDDNITEAKSGISNAEDESKANVENCCHGNSETESEYLQTIWKKLAVGKDGFLQLEELERVCQHIGMENISQEVVSQLFAKLDMDQDGKISFQEFLHLFENGEPSTNSSRTLSNSSTPQHVARGWKTTPHNLKSTDQCKEERCEANVNSTSESGMFSSIDPDNKGYVKREVLVELWDSLGFSNGTQIIKDLGFDSSFIISLQDLSIMLEECLTSSDDTFMHNVAVVTIQHELKFVRNSLDQLKGERNKLRGDVAEANLRAAMLAQEVDDQNAKLEKTSQNKIIIIEKKYKEQLQAVQDELCQERDHLTAQIARAQQSMEAEISQLRQEEFSLKDRMTFLQSENERLDVEVRELTDKLNESQRLYHHQQKDMEALAIFRQQIEELESGRAFLPEEQHETLLMELQSLKLENQSLRDQNDELALRVESLRLQLSSRPAAKASSHKRNGSSLGDYVRSSAVKRRGNERESFQNSADESNQSSLNLVLGKNVCKMQENGNNSLDKDLGQGTWTNEMVLRDFEFGEDDAPRENWSNCGSTGNLKEKAKVVGHPVGGSISTMCELKQVFAHLRKTIAADYGQDDSWDESSEEMQRTLNDLREENINLQKRVDDLSCDRSKEMDNLSVSSHECLMSELKECSEAEVDVSVSVTTQTETFTTAGRCDTLEARLEVAMDELEMSLAREAQGEELLLEFERKYLQLRERLSNDFISSCESESERLLEGAGDAAPYVKFPCDYTKVSHISKNLLESVMEEILRPLESFNRNSRGDFNGRSLLVVRMLRDFLLSTTEIVKDGSQSGGIFCGTGTANGQIYLSAADTGCDNLRSWLTLTSTEDDIQSILKAECQELKDEMGLEKDECLKAVMEEEMLRRKKAEQFECEMELLREYVIELEAKVNGLTTTDCGASAVELTLLNVETQTYEIVEEEKNLDETIEELRTEKSLLNKACEELQKLKCNLEKEFAVMENDLERKLTMQLNRVDDETACSSTSVLDVQFEPRGLEEQVVLQSRRSFVQLTNHSKEKSCLIGMGILHSLNEKLRQLERRCQFLEETSRTQALKAEKQEKIVKQQHVEEMSKVKKMLSSTQTMLKQQAADYETQLKVSDSLVKQLFVENSELVKALQVTEEREKKADRLNVHLHDKCQALSELVANIYKTATA